MVPDASHSAARYRPEIDGLRALAVLPVILFHAGFSTFRGGFVGVDVFFVISGYLITSIIVGDCEGGRFSIGSFYERRARRILPALFVVMAACLPFVWSWMLPAQTQAFGRSMLATLDFVPNLYFWSTTQYFANTAEEIPLLHTWSLGVEEQFYLVFPLLIWGLWRFGLRAIAGVTLLLALLSFGLSEWAWRHGKLSSDFFLPVTRAWELMLGALLAFTWRAKPVCDRVSLAWNQCLSALGVGALAYAVLVFDSYTPMPGVYALVPTLGAALVIAFARPGTWVHRILAHRALVGIGLISYSAYLWHQPLFAFARVRLGVEPPLPLLVGLILVTALLAYLTWRFVETPFRSAGRIRRRTLVRAALAGAAMFVLIGVVSERTQGFAFRLPTSDVALAKLIDMAAQEDYESRRFVGLDHDFSDDATLKIAVVGDSYAQDFINAVFESGRLGAGVELRTFYVAATCQPYFGGGNVDAFISPPQYQSSCRLMRDATPLRHRIARADVVVFASSWERWAIERLPESVEHLHLRPEQRLIFVGPKRVGRIDIRQLLQIPVEQRVVVSQKTSSETSEVESMLRQAVPGSTFMSMQDMVCGAGPSCNLFTPQGDLISFDGTHLTQAGARFAGLRMMNSESLAALSGVAH